MGAETVLERHHLWSIQMRTSLSASVSTVTRSSSSISLSTRVRSMRARLMAIR